MHHTGNAILFLCWNCHSWDMEMVQKVIRDMCDNANFDNVSDEYSLDITLTLILKSTLAHSMLHASIMMNNNQ